MDQNMIMWTDLVVKWFLEHGIKILVIPIAAWILMNMGLRFIHRALRISIVKDRHRPAEAEKMREETLIRIFGGTLKVLIYIIAGLMILTELGVEIAPLLAGAGIVGLAFGFGGQYLIKDIITGLFLILENQYRIGDVVAFDNTSGLVEDISLRVTKLRDMDGTVHHVPHGSITRVANMSKDFSRVNLNIGVSYNAELEQIIEVINRTGKSLMEDPVWTNRIRTAPQFLRIDSFGDSAVILKITGETLPLQQWDVTGELRKRLKIEFDKEGIEIPFPQRVVHHVKEKQADK